ncbi:Sugar transferase involved in LPS biosynthesis (colanic, teichoic acid) [Proteiniborus ethanoligenes]|uniref:Sugar transferase involved in LPS biosynthesis (Colanic, teichoic acid) n=1 Tax=Proteiniborus ethanoligenes TaxID=415015 RepID=A0A1H3LRI4_9FIRM|nr:sugar transferase [Proteiniborus ethanoligenes]SDY66634.1 Sugar transferase involved in LPS biosynthesis (colanic, teichoic acid) [Proteiniborus ethanoligenes]
MYRNFFKRIIDLVLAIIVLPFWLIILVIIGPIIYFQDKGSIFYNAPRLGKDGKIFKMYKFRSMKMDAPDLRNEDGSTFNAEDDPRLTKIGKFIRKTSLDETPQLLNVIKGDMSLVGPRPDLPDAIDIYDENDAQKLKAKPGITGFNQAYSRNSSSLKDKFADDVYYVNNISIFLDIKILFKTIKTVILCENIYKDLSRIGERGKFHE